MAEVVSTWAQGSLPPPCAIAGIVAADKTNAAIIGVNFSEFMTVAFL
jgi:hypothetical protein